MKKIKKVSTLIYKGREFIIATYDDMYVSIETKYITNGRLNTSLNGFQTKVSKSIDDCIKARKCSVDLDELIEKIGEPTPQMCLDIVNKHFGYI